MRFGGRAAADSILDPSKVDLVVEAADGQIELVIVQPGSWTGSDEQLQSFQSKVQTYVSFAVDGELAARFPEATDRPWVITIRSLVGPPDRRTSGVIDALTERLVAYGGFIQAD
jgi:hypothetical protein